jgi:hypothetical protein
MQDTPLMFCYYAQLEALAARCRIPLPAAMRKAKVADSQLYRWRMGKGSPRLDTARRIERAILALGAKNAAALPKHVRRAGMAKSHAPVPGSPQPARPAS